MRYLTPHSKEWFAALAKINPQEAAHAKQVIKSAGTPEVCSECGGSPAGDYEIKDKWFAPDALVTVRLCEDCMSNRATGEGEHFIPLSALSGSDAGAQAWPRYTA
jgi:hypothetical protein